MKTTYYFSDGTGRIKIGQSRNWRDRLESMVSSNPTIECLATEPRNRQYLRHEQFAEDHLNGQWFLESEILAEWIGFVAAAESLNLKSYEERLELKN
jgi:hypothetical protein